MPLGARGAPATSSSATATCAASTARTSRSARTTTSRRPTRFRSSAWPEMALELQGRGCHNIGFVSPTHFAPQMAKGDPPRGAARPSDSGRLQHQRLRLGRGAAAARRGRRRLPAGLQVRRLRRGRALFQGARTTRGASREALIEMYRQKGPRLEMGEDEDGPAQERAARAGPRPAQRRGRRRRVAGLDRGDAVALASRSRSWRSTTRSTARLEREVPAPSPVRSRPRSGQEALDGTRSRMASSNGFEQELETSNKYYRPDFTDREDAFQGHPRLPFTVVGASRHGGARVRHYARDGKSRNRVRAGAGCPGLFASRGFRSAPDLDRARRR